MALRSIEIQGYKSIKSQKVHLEAMNVLIGQNGAGKSNFISAFKFLHNIIEGRLQHFTMKVGAESLMYYGSKETKKILFSLDVSPGFYKLDLEVKENDTLHISSEVFGNWEKNKEEPEWQYMGKSEVESNLSKKITWERLLISDLYRFFNHWGIYHFHDTSETAGVKKYAAIADNRFLFEDASNLAPFLYVLRETEPKHYDRLVKTIQIIVPSFKDFVLRPNPLNQENIRLEWQDRYSDKTFTANQLSDGTLRFICMATLLLQKNLPQLILLDEPELGLHPTAITLLASLLRKASKRSQVIISTQSVSLVNEFEAADIIVVENVESQTVFKRLHSEQLSSWLEEYTLGELWDKNIIGGKP